MSWVEAAITAGGVVAAAFFGWLGVRATVRRGRAADTAQREQQRDTNLVEELRLQYKRNTDILARQDRLEAEMRTERMRRESLSRELDEERRERQKLTALYTRLERRFQEALVYIRDLLDRLRENDLDEPVAPDWLAAAIPRDEDSE